MSRPLRIEYAGAWYHVMNRGQERKRIFINPGHFEDFLALVEEASNLFSTECHAYCLMNNHYHLLIHTPVGNLARTMRHINGIYTQRFNKGTNRDGPLFRGRYKAILIEKDSYLSQVSRYIHLNPVEAKIVMHPKDYEWSSYRYYHNPTNKPAWLHLCEVLAQMNSTNPAISYRNFVNKYGIEEIDTFYSKRHQGIILGSNSFKDKCLAQIKSSFLEECRPELHQSECIPTLKEIIEITAEYYGVPAESIRNSRQSMVNRPRKTAMFIARNGFSYRMSEIADAMTWITPRAVSSAVYRYKKEMDSVEFLEIKEMIMRRMINET